MQELTKEGGVNVPNRIIKESICSSDTIEQLELFEEVFFYRLIVNCDDFGRFDARTSILKARLFPLKATNITDETIEATIRKLEEVGLILIYFVDSRPYLQVITWADHQTIRNKRSKYPSVDERNKALEYKCNQVNTKVSVIQSNPIQSNPNPNPIQKGEQVALDIGINNSNEEPNKPKYKHIKTQIEEFTTDDELKNVLYEFVEMRTKLRKKPTDYAFTLILKKLSNLSGDVNIKKEIVNQSVVSSWVDIYPLKKDYVSRFNKKEKDLPSWYGDYEKGLKGQIVIPKEATREELKEMANLTKQIGG